MPDQEPKIHKKSVTVRFADLEVSVSTEDKYQIGSISQHALDVMSILIKERISYARFIDDDCSDSGDVPPDTVKSAIVEPKTVLKAYG